MANEAQFIQLFKCWSCDIGQALLWRRTGPFLLTAAGAAVFGASRFAEHTSQT